MTEEGFREWLDNAIKDNERRQQNAAASPTREAYYTGCLSTLATIKQRLPPEMFLTEAFLSYLDEEIDELSRTMEAVNRRSTKFDECQYRRSAFASIKEKFSQLINNK